MQKTAAHMNTSQYARSAVRIALLSRALHNFTHITKSGNPLPVKGWMELEQRYAVVEPEADNPQCSNALDQKFNITYLDGAQYRYIDTFYQSVVSKVAAGETKFKEINRVAFVE